MYYRLYMVYLQVEFSSLDFLLHTRALLSTVNSLNRAVPNFTASKENDIKRRAGRVTADKTGTVSHASGFVHHLLSIPLQTGKIQIRLDVKLCALTELLLMCDLPQYSQAKGLGLGNILTLVYFLHGFNSVFFWYIGNDCHIHLKHTMKLYSGRNSARN